MCHSTGDVNVAITDRFNSSVRTSVVAARSKGSAVALEKDFWRERMRSALEDSRACC